MELIRMNDAIHRTCRRCGKVWNVSCIDPGPKVYICPVCEYREKLKRCAQVGHGRRGESTFE